MTNQQITLTVKTAWWLTPAITILFAWTKITRRMPNSNFLGWLVSKSMRVSA